MRYVVPLFALLLPLPALAADALAALNLARAELLAVQLPQTADALARGDGESRLVLGQLRARALDLHDRLPADDELERAWTQLDADLRALLACPGVFPDSPAPDAILSPPPCREQEPVRQASADLSRDSLAFVQRADFLLGGGG